jgi:hypothetical protein
MNLSSLITSSLALLAFIVAFYALLAKERKTPYITRSIYRLAAGVIISVILMLVAQAVQAWKFGIGRTLATTPAQGGNAQTVPMVGWALGLAVSGIAFFFVVLVGVVLNIWRLHNRDVHLLDTVKIKNLVPVRWIRYKLRQIRGQGKYEFKPLPIDHEAATVALKEAGFATGELPSTLLLVSICGIPARKYDPSLLGLIRNLLVKGWRVQYTTCSRHPFDLIHRLEKELGPEQWSRLANQLIVVDAYAPHFGFTDSVHWKQRDSLEVKFVSSAKSYAGIHTAITRAFNILKKDSHGDLRENALVIYEGCNALVDLESHEQYRIFVRHVVPSERMWGGMLTVFIEPCIETEERDLLDSYADLVVTQIYGDAVQKGTHANI